MSTTFYVRTYNCSFPTYAPGSVSRNQVSYMEGGTLRNYTNLFSTFPPRSFGRIDSSNFILPIGDNGGASYSIGDSLRTSLESSNWDFFYTPSNLTTFKTELCTYFNNNKTDTSNGLFWGSDNSQINLLFFIVTFDNDPGKTYYTNCFYHGNDPQRDEEIVI